MRHGRRRLSMSNARLFHRFGGLLPCPVRTVHHMELAMTVSATVVSAPIESRRHGQSGQAGHGQMVVVGSRRVGCSYRPHVDSEHLDRVRSKMRVCQVDNPISAPWSKQPLGQIVFGRVTECQHDIGIGSTDQPFPPIFVIQSVFFDLRSVPDCFEIFTFQ